MKRISLDFIGLLAVAFTAWGAYAIICYVVDMARGMTV